MQGAGWIGRRGGRIERRSGGEDKALEIEEGVDEAGGEETVGCAIGELGAMGGDGIEFALADGANVECDVGAFGRCAEGWGSGTDGVGVGAVGHALPLGEEEAASK